MCDQSNRDLWFHPLHEAGESGSRRAEPAMRLVLVGPPGVGKGTQAALLCRRYRACHLSTGDLFRAASCETDLSPAMQTALDTMRAGGLVSDDLVMELVRERGACLRCCGGFLLDGVPRTLPQAQALGVLLDELHVTLDGVILYDLPAEEIAARICGRRTCPNCKAVYHETAQPPLKSGVCDRCQTALVQRDDDQPEVVRTRLAAYRDATEPLIDFYRDRGELVAVSAAGTPEEVFQRACEALRKHRSGAPAPPTRRTAVQA